MSLSKEREEEIRAGWMDSTSEELLAEIDRLRNAFQERPEQNFQCLMLALGEIDLLEKELARLRAQVMTAKVALMEVSMVPGYGQSDTSYMNIADTALAKLEVGRND